MKRISVVLAIFLCSMLLFGPLLILKGMVLPGESKKQDMRVHLNTGNTTRVLGKNPEEVSLQVSEILYSAVDRESKPKGVILLQSKSWQDIVSVLPLVRIYDSPVILGGSQISREVRERIKKVSPGGISKLKGVQTLVFSKNPSPEEGEILKAVLDIPQGLKVKRVTYNDTEELQEKVSKLPGITQDSTYGFIVPFDNPHFAIPAATWVVRQGGKLLFAKDNGEIYNSARKMLDSGKLKQVYVLAEKGKSEANNLEKYKVEVSRITAGRPEQLSIRFAEFYDSRYSVGWDAHINRLNVGHNYILCAKQTPEMAAVAAQLAVRGKSGPMLWTEQKRISPEIENYLWKMKPDFWVTPAEGPYNHLWVIGDDNVLSYNIQGRAGYTQEIQNYEMLGEQAVGGLDALAILSVLSGLAGALWVAFHLFFRMKKIFILTKMMWILATIMLGPIGVWLYIVSHKDRPWMMMGDNIMWKRPLWNQAAVATIRGLAFGASTMIVVGFLLAWLGLPLVPLPAANGLFLFGNPMIIQMIIVYIVALILNSTVFMPVFLMQMRKLSYPEAVKNAIPIVLISMTSVSLGMMTAMWFLNMESVPMMPEEDHILWWGIMQLSTLIGALVAYVPNWWLVRYGRKMGAM